MFGPVIEEEEEQLASTICLLSICYVLLYYNIIVTQQNHSGGNAMHVFAGALALWLCLKEISYGLLCTKTRTTSITHKLPDFGTL